MKKHLINETPRFIYFTGVDGSGKSSIIEMLIPEYSKHGIDAKRVWLRFNYLLTRPVLLYCRLTGLTRRVYKDGKVYSIHDFYKSKVISTMVQYLHLIDTAIAYLLKVWFPLKFTQQVILCDKFVYDILVDFMVETRELSLLDKAITRLFLRLLPKDACVFAISVDKEEIIRRKPIVLIEDEEYDLKYKAYQLVMDRFRLTTIRNDNIDDTISKIKEMLNI